MKIVVIAKINPTQFAEIRIDGDTSDDDDGDVLTYEWNTGVEPEAFTDLNGNGVWDPAEELIDWKSNKDIITDEELKNNIQLSMYYWASHQ